MKRSRKVSLVFHAACVAAIAGGYLLGTSPLFANCGQCLYCDSYTIYASCLNEPGLEGCSYFGYTLKGTNASWTPFAFNGSPNKATYTLYDVPCPYEGGVEQTPADPPVMVSVWTFDTLAFKCDVPSGPSYPFIQPADSGTNQQPTYGPINQMVCGTGGS